MKFGDEVTVTKGFYEGLRGRVINVRVSMYTQSYYLVRIQYRINDREVVIKRWLGSDILSLIQNERSKSNKPNSV